MAAWAGSMARVRHIGRDAWMRAGVGVTFRKEKEEENSVAISQPRELFP